MPDGTALAAAPPQEPDAILRLLSGALDGLSPQVRQAAAYVLENPGQIAVSSMRTVADTAGVKPNTLVRMARAVGFPGYDEFRAPFRERAAEGAVSFPDRARFLQGLGQGTSHGEVLAGMAGASLANLETMFASISANDLVAAADLVNGARHAYVLGVGTSKPLAQNFAYVAGMALDNVVAIPTIGLAVDDVGRMTDRDTLVAITYSPFRVEIVEAVRLAASRRVPIVAVTNTHASPLIPVATHAFVVPNESPLPWSSNVAATALLETLLAFMFGRSEGDVAAAIDLFHTTRRAAGIYTSASG